MANENKLILPGLILAGGLAAFIVSRNVKRVSQNLRFNFKNIDTLKLDWQEIKLRVNFNYINPEPIDVKINSIFADVLIGNIKAGAVVDFNSKIIKGKSTGVLSFPLNIKTAILPQLLEKLLDGELSGGTLDGYFDLPSGRVKFKENFDINI
jgi:LEA14-like dessication related protein